MTLYLAAAQVPADQFIGLGTASNRVHPYKLT